MPLGDKSVLDDAWYSDLFLFLWRCTLSLYALFMMRVTIPRFHAHCSLETAPNAAPKTIMSYSIFFFNFYSLVLTVLLAISIFFKRN